VGRIVLAQLLAIHSASRVDRIWLIVDPNDLLGVTMFDIPTAITKYLTYVLILHIIALALALASTIFGLLSFISSLSVLCFPTCFAACASTCSLIALVVDLAMFYIAKARIDRVDGASASIGIAVWLTLAAWLLCGFAGCAYGIGRCCVGSRDRKARDDPDPSRGGYVRTPNSHGPDAMRMDAIRDEQIRKKEQGLPSFAAFEREPLQEDKYDDPAQAMPGALRRDGSMVQGVGMGYGRRTDARTPLPTENYNAGYGYPPVGGLARRPSDSMMTDAGDAGLGAGGGGVETGYPQDPCESTLASCRKVSLTCRQQSSRIQRIRPKRLQRPLSTAATTSIPSCHAHARSIRSQRPYTRFLRSRGCIHDTRPRRLWLTYARSLRSSPYA